jgi:hypothetical protein
VKFRRKTRDPDEYAGVVRSDGHTIVGRPKSDAGVRDVAIPPHLVPMLKTHRDAMPLRGISITLRFVPAAGRASLITRPRTVTVCMRANVISMLRSWEPGATSMGPAASWAPLRP